jgi:hypothetical protein
MKKGSLGDNWRVGNLALTPKATAVTSEFPVAVNSMRACKLAVYVCAECYFVETLLCASAVSGWSFTITTLPKVDPEMDFSSKLTIE